MLPFRGFPTEAVFAFASLLTSVLISSPSRSSAAFADDLAIENYSQSTTLVSMNGSKERLERSLFELASPFEFINDQCAFTCNAQEEESEDNGEGPLINACPKVSLQKISVVPFLTLKYRLESYSGNGMQPSNKK